MGRAHVREEACVLRAEDLQHRRLPDNFFAYVYDFNGDKKNDILILGFPGKEARLCLNPGDPASDTVGVHIVADVLTTSHPSSPTLATASRRSCTTGGSSRKFAELTNRRRSGPLSPSVDMKVASYARTRRGVDGATGL